MQIDREFLDILNTKDVTADHWRNFLKAAEQDKTFYSSGIQSAHQAICDAVRVWVDSGFQADGSEVIENRHVSWKAFPAAIGDMGSLFNSDLSGDVGGDTWLSASQHKKNHPLYGNLRVRIEPQGGFTFDPVLFDTRLEANELAALAFFLFWKSPLLYTLMRCSHCGVFAIPRNAIKSYVRGWQCKRCQPSASAMAATDAARRSFRKQWFGLAVEAQEKWESLRHRDVDHIAFILKYVNDKLPKVLARTDGGQGRNYKKIKRNTITMNLNAIKAGKDPKAEQHATPNPVHH